MSALSLNIKRFLLVIGDLAIYHVALVCMLTIRYGGLYARDWNLHIVPFAIVAVLWVFGSFIAGLYDLHLNRDGIKFFRLYLEGMTANLAIALAFFYLIPVFNIAPRTNLFLYFAIAILLGYVWRLIYNRFITNTLFRHRLVFIGNPTDAAKIFNLLQNSGLEFDLVAVVETSPGPRMSAPHIRWSTSLKELDHLITEERIDTILLGHRPDDIPDLRDALYRTLFLPVSILDRTTLEETLTGRVPLEFVSQTWFLEHLRENEKTWYETLKRVMDIVLAIPVVIATLILLPFIGLAMLVLAPGPLFYSQIRTGKLNKPFRIWKFRTMRLDAETAGKPQWATQGDPRITPLGRFLRATRIDELPQIWNVLRGDMSLIGPRPERPEFVEELTAQMPYYALRHLTRPGLTGWAQVKFPYAGSVEDNLKKLQYDLYYIKHRSPLLDFAILLRTIGIVLRRQGT